MTEYTKEMEEINALKLRLSKVFNKIGYAMQKIWDKDYVAAETLLREAHSMSCVGQPRECGNCGHVTVWPLGVDGYGFATTQCPKCEYFENLEGTWKGE